MRTSTNTRERPCAIVIGLDGLNGIQTARILASRHVPVIAVAKDRWHPYCSTLSCGKILVADTASEQCIELLDSLKSQFNTKAVLVPCEDEGVLLISRHRRELERSYHIALPHPDVVETLIDKVKFYRYAQDHGLPIPHTVFLDDARDVRRASNEIGFPCLVKPGRRTASWMREVEIKAFRVRSEGELMNVYERYRPHADSLLAQMWIEGGDTELYACNCYFNAGSEPLVTFTSRKLRQWPPHVGRGCLGVECRADDVQRQTVDLFRAVRYHGLGYLEMKRDERSGEAFIVEPNVGRPTGRSALAEAAGVELLYTMYCDLAGWPLPEARQQLYRGVKWIYLRQDIQSALYSWRAGETGLGGILRSWRGRKTFSVFSWTDPGPFFFDLLWIAGRLFSARGRAFLKRLESNRAKPAATTTRATNAPSGAPRLKPNGADPDGPNRLRDWDLPGGRLAQFMELRGRRVVEACGVLWHAERGFLLSCPYEARLDPDPEELNDLLRSSRAVGARFSSLVWPGLPGGSYLFYRRKYGLDSIHPQYRRKVRRGLEQLEIRPVDKSELLTQGLQLNLDTMSRQGRNDAEFGGERQWKRLVDAVYGCSGVSAIGAFRANRLSAYGILCREGRGLYILHHMSRSADLRCYPNHVLTYEITRRASEDASLDFVSYGLGSPVRAPGLHDYKSRFGYVYSRQNSVITFHPWLGSLVSRPAHALARSMRRLRPRDYMLAQIESVIGGALLSKG